VVWTARIAWIVLPFTTGAAFDDVLQPWSRAPQTVGEVLLWAAWFAGLIALLAPRPWGFTILRVVAPYSVAIAIASAWSAPWLVAVLAIATASFAMVTALSSAIAHACAASTAYGPEQRFPLRVPVTLLAGPLPIAAALIGAAIASGPLLLANGDLVAGVVASQHNQGRPGASLPATTTSAPSTTTRLPAALNDAITRLEQAVAK